MVANPSALDINLAELLKSWKRVLVAENKANSTIRNYMTGVENYLAWCATSGEPPVIERQRVIEWVAELLATGLEPSTVKARQLAVRRFSAWLDGEDDVPYNDQLLGIRPPRLSEKLVQPLSERDLALLLFACEGKAFRDRRDEAALRLMMETGMRVGEVIALTLDDVNLDNGLVSIRKAKSGRGRVVPISAKAVKAMDKYIRLRRAHPLADWRNLWLGERGHSLTYVGLRASLLERAEIAGIKNFHPHLLRHTAASRWLSAGGSEQGLMTMAGWSDRSMLDRYSRSTAATRAQEEARRLNLGEFG